MDIYIYIREVVCLYRRPKKGNSMINTYRKVYNSLFCMYVHKNIDLIPLMRGSNGNRMRNKF